MNSINPNLLRQISGAESTAPPSSIALPKSLSKLTQPIKKSVMSAGAKGLAGLKRKGGELAQLPAKLQKVDYTSFAKAAKTHAGEAIKDELQKLEDKFGEGSLKVDSKLFQDVKKENAAFKDQKADLENKMKEAFKSSPESALKFSKQLDALVNNFQASNSHEPNKSIVTFLNNSTTTLEKMKSFAVSSTKNEAKVLKQTATGISKSITSQSKAQVGALNDQISNASSSANQVFKNLQSALNEMLAKKPEAAALDVKEFLGNFDKQITKEEHKLASLKDQHANATGQDKDDLGNSINQLDQTVTQMKAIRSEVEQSGTKYLKNMRTKGSDNIASAKDVAASSIKSGEDYLQSFEDIAKSLVLKSVPKDSDKEAKLLTHLENLSTECKGNLEACKERLPHAELWGLLGSWKLNGSELSKNQDPSVIHMNAKVISPSRLNSGELMPAFIESFHKDVLMNDVLGGLNLNRPGAGDLSSEQIKDNLAKFQALTNKSGEGSPMADKLNEAYSNLTAAYKGRSADPKKYLNEVNSFIDLYQSLNT